MPIDKNIKPPPIVCKCGWVSHDERYSLKYHAETHKCKKARAMINFGQSLNG